MKIPTKSMPSPRSMRGGKVGAPALAPMKMPKVGIKKPRKPKFGYV